MLTIQTILLNVHNELKQFNYVNKYHNYHLITGHPIYKVEQIQTLFELFKPIAPIQTI